MEANLSCTLPKYCVDVTLHESRKSSAKYFFLKCSCKYMAKQLLLNKCNVELHQNKLFFNGEIFIIYFAIPCCFFFFPLERKMFKTNIFKTDEKSMLQKQMLNSFHMSSFLIFQVPFSVI